MKTTLVTIGMAALMTMATVTACGGEDNSSSGGYCDDLRAAKSSFVGLTQNQIDQGTFEKLLTDLHTLRDEAPADVKAAWTTFSQAADDFNAALQKAGMTMDDVRQMGAGGHMDTGHDMDIVMRAARSLGSIAVGNAQAKITASAKKDCDVDL